jgi:hypothetical protein
VKQKDPVEVKDYSAEVQKVLIQFMISDPTAFVRCQNIIRPQYWEENLRPAVRYIQKFAEEYRVLPTPEQVEAESGVPLRRSMTSRNNTLSGS